jgi:hypothetical protein
MVRALAGDSTMTSLVPRPAVLAFAPEVLAGTLFYLTSGGNAVRVSRRYHPGGDAGSSVLSGN